MRIFYACYWCGKRCHRYNPSVRVDGDTTLYLCNECSVRYDDQEKFYKRQTLVGAVEG